MFKLGRSSFRRILLSRMLLLSIPVLLMGEYVTYRKARSALLETARQNLTESAIRKGQSIQASVKSIEATLLTASESTILQSGSMTEINKYLQMLDKRLPTKVQCAQLTDLATQKIVASTCGSEPIYAQLSADQWQKPNQGQSLIDVSLILSYKQEPEGDQTGGAMKLVFMAPVYQGGGTQAGSLRYALTLQSTLEQEKVGRKGSLTGRTVVIDVFDTTYQQENGTIVEHLSPDRAGTKIDEEADTDRLRSIIRNAIAGRQDFVHLFDFEAPNIELISGYTAIPSPLSPEKHWIILAVTRLDNALIGLQDIQQVLFTLVLGLVAANLVVTWYLTRELARPIEQLQDYASNVHRRKSDNHSPLKLKIQEFQQLADSLDTMVDRLKAWATELETAWQEAKVANQLKNEFLATISHELRTPLNAIIGCIRLVRDDCCDDKEEEVEFLQRADDAAIHLLNIINDILDISKIEAGTLSVTMEPVYVSEVIKEVLEIQENAITQKGLGLSVNEYPEPLVVEADPAKLKQVLLNLVNNCIKFTDTGTITIATRIESNYTEVMNRVSTKTETVDGNGTSAVDVVISLQDTGIGIAPEQQQKLFQPFVMVDGSTTRRHGGTGLGLAIARNLIELMGGTIMLNSKGIGQGTTVDVVLPKVNLLPSSAQKQSSKTAMKD
jgi:signal transduction histidine kinase